MRLFAYYTLHSLKNQIKKLFKTWVLIFFIACFAIGGAIGGIAASVSNHIDEQNGETEIVASEDEENDEDLNFFERNNVDKEQFVETVAGGIILILIIFMAYSADKNGSKIFLPADVNLLFPSPMKPQSVLMFRLATQLGMALVGSIYLIFQLPNLILNMGMSTWAALAILLTWCLALMAATLIQVLLYVLASTHPGTKKYIRTGIYAIIAVVAIGYILCVRSGMGYFESAVSLLCFRGSRFIPIWGWIKGFCASAAAGDTAPCLAYLAATVIGGGILIYLIWHIKADFYEDAMAKSEETAAAMERAQAEKSTGFAKRKKDRSDKLRRDGMGHGSGANVFFFKTMYNRFRFAHLGFFTKTLEFYLVAALGTAAIMRFAAGSSSVTILALVLSGLSFFRALGNPLEQDASMDYFILIPESTQKKLFWSVIGSTVNCLLDVLPGLIVGTIFIGGNPLLALVWLPFIVSVDFYSTTVGAFIGFSVPANAGKMLKQIVQVMFVYFGLLPDIAIIAIAFVLDSAAVGIICAAVLNFALGFIFFFLCPLFLDPRNGRTYEEKRGFAGDMKRAKKHFSILGLGIFTIFLVGNILQYVVVLLVPANMPAWANWLATFAPIYLVAIPVGILIMRKVPSIPPRKSSFGFVNMVKAIVISIFMMYAGNIVGTLITTAISTLFGHESLNPILTLAQDESLVAKILVMVIIGPLIEEFLFRKQLIDRMNVYGGKLAVFTSALLFGLFHGNLSQCFYAFSLGLVFGYVYLKTGKLRYSACMHMLINFLGSIVAPALLENLNLEAIDSGNLDIIASSLPQIAMFGAYVLIMLSLAVVGLVLLCLNARNIRFAGAELELPKGTRFKTAYLNIGMILAILICLASIVLMIFM